jgi:hypothetical protein
MLVTGVCFQRKWNKTLFKKITLLVAKKKKKKKKNLTFISLKQCFITVVLIKATIVFEYHIFFKFLILSSQCT